MIVLDTHAWIWWASESPELSRRAVTAIAEADAIGVAAISCWEVAMLVARGRLTFRHEIGEWINFALARPRVRLEPLEPEVAVLATRLPGDFHGDPADRMIVATSLRTGSSLVTKDEHIHRWGQVDVLW